MIPITKENFNLLNKFKSNDLTTRESMRYPHVKDNILQATDDRRLVQIKNSYKDLKNGYYEVFKKSNSEFYLIPADHVDVSFPDFTKVIPEKTKGQIKFTYTKEPRNKHSQVIHFDTQVIRELSKRTDNIIFQGIQDQYLKDIPDKTYTVEIYTNSKNELKTYYFYTDDLDIVIAAMSL